MGGGTRPVTRDENPGARDAVLRLIGNETRREVIRVLMKSEGEAMTIDDLAASTARPPERRDVAIRLHHVHMPMLAEANLIEFEPKSGRVGYLGDEAVETMLDSLETRQAEDSDE